MKVVHVSLKADIRIVKQVAATNKQGIKNHSISSAPWFMDRLSKDAQEQASYFETQTQFVSRPQLVNAIELYPDADLFHIHATPYWLTSVVRSVFPSAKIVLDAGDSLLQIFDPESAHATGQDERNNFILADALVFNTIEMQETITNLYGLGEVPACVVGNQVPSDFYCEGGDQLWVGGVVYHGTVIPGDTIPKDQGFNRFYAMSETVEALVKAGIKVCIYTPSILDDQPLWPQKKGKRIKKHYEDLGARVFPPLAYQELLRRLPSFQFGLMGNLMPTRVWDLAMPNKLFDCIAAGLPILAFKARTLGKVIEEYKIGIHCQSIEEFVDRMGEELDCRRNVVAKRDHFTMENNIAPLMELYAKLLIGGGYA